MNWLSWDDTQTRLQYRDVNDEDLVCGGFSLSSSFRLSSSYFLQTFHIQTFPLHIRRPFQWRVACVCRMCTNFRKTKFAGHERQSVLMISDWTWNVCIVTRYYSFANTHSLTLVCYFMCSAVVHAKRKQVKIKHCCTL